MLGSAFEAEDAVQETFVRAWRGYDRFEGRAALRSWLYRIATNVCLEHARRQPAPRPADGPVGPRPARTVPLARPAARGDLDRADPGRRSPCRPAAIRPRWRSRARSIRLAFVAALQHLPPRQRAVLILREVLRWKADEVAELLDTTVASVNSALQRARATLAANDVSDPSPPKPMDDAHQALLARYVDAFERYDMDSLTALLHEDAHVEHAALRAVAPDPRGHRQVVPWAGHRMRGLPPRARRGERLTGVRASTSRVRTAAWSRGRSRSSSCATAASAGITFFLDTERLFPLFGLPPQLEA